MCFILWTQILFYIDFERNCIKLADLFGQNWHQIQSGFFYITPNSTPNLFFLPFYHWLQGFLSSASLFRLRSCSSCPKPPLLQMQRAPTCRWQSMPKMMMVTEDMLQMLKETFHLSYLQIAEGSSVPCCGSTYLPFGSLTSIKPKPHI